MLPVLKQAGVIDSGGAGFVIFIQEYAESFSTMALEQMVYRFQLY